MLFRSLPAEEYLLVLVLIFVLSMDILTLEDCTLNYVRRQDAEEITFLYEVSDSLLFHAPDVTIVREPDTG